jgi:hypothetical protein
MTSRPAPTPESLSLSASLFTSRISSWLPADFGHTVPNAQKTADFELTLRSAGSSTGESDRLGLGHPKLAAPESGGGPSRAGLAHLQKRLGGGKGKGKGTAGGKEETAPVSGVEDGEDEDEGESRASSIGKRKKGGNLDLLLGKKGRKATSTPAQSSTPARSSIRPSPAPSPASASRTPDNLPPSVQQDEGADVDDDDDPPPFTPPRSGTTSPPRHTATSSPGGSGIFPFFGPLALDSPQAKRLISDRKARRQEVLHADESYDQDEEERDDAVIIQELGEADATVGNDGAGSGGSPRKQELSKTQLRREKRRLAKLAQAARDQAKRR